MSDDDRQRPPNFQNLQSLVLPPVPRASNHNGSATSNITHADLSRRQLSTTTRGQHSSEPYPKSSNKGGVRGRVTVVCAECKRLKLRCSRERPCTSCIKRACTDRCRYRNDEQPLASTPSGEQRSIIPTTASGEQVYRLVSTNCVMCSTHNIKCDRREPCSHCIKGGVDCVYQGLAPLALPSESTLAHALTRLSRLESRLGEIGPECDQCAELHLKCDGNSPCSWCRKRHSGNPRIAGELEAIGLNLPNHHAAGGVPPCTYSGYSERQGARSPQSTLHANTGNGSRDLSPYALRVSSPPPPGSSHSSTSTATDNILSRIASAESQLSNYMRTTQNHNFSHGHSLSHGSATSMASASGAGGGGSGAGVNGPGLGGQSFGSSTLTPITPSHPSSLHHYVVSGSGGGHSHSHSHSHSGHHHSYSQTDPLHHSHHHQQQPQQQQPQHHHQRSSSRHSPPQHPNSAHLQPLESSSYSPDGRQETHRPRQLSMSNSSVHLPRHQGSNMTPTTSPGSYGFSSRETMTKPLKIPTPPGSGSSPALPSQQSAGASSQQGGTKLPEISNILTLLSPAPISSSTNESKSPHAFPTPVSGVVSSSHSILNIGVGPNIQHTQSDVRGSTNTSTSSVRHGHQGSDSSRRGSADYNARPSSREDVPSTSTSPPLHRSASASRPNSSDAPQQPHHQLHHKRSNSPLPSSHPIGSTGSLYPPGQQHRRENSGPMDAEYEKDRGVYQQQLQQQREQMQAADKSHPANRLARPHSRREEEEEDDDDDEMEVEVDEIDD